MTISVLAAREVRVYENRMKRKRDNRQITRDWIVKGLGKPGKTGAGLARALDLPQPRVPELKKGTRQLKLIELSKAAAYLDEPIPAELLDVDGTGGLALQAVPHLSWVSAGLMVSDDLAQAQLGTAYTVGLPPGDWIALTVKGDSMNRISPNDSIIFVNRRERQLAPNGLYVIDDGEGKATYKRYRTGPPPRFEAVSTDSIDPLFFDQEPVVVGRVRRSVYDMM